MLSDPGPRGGHLKRRNSSPPTLPQALVANAAGAAGEIFVPHHTSPMAARRGVALSLPTEIAAEGHGGAAGEIFVPHHDSPMSSRRRVTLSLGSGVVPPGGGGAAGEIFVPHHDDPVRQRRGVNLSIAGVVSEQQGGASGAAGEIFVPHRDGPVGARRNVKLTSLAAAVPPGGGGAAGEIYVPHHDTNVRDRRGISLSLPADLVAVSHGTAGEMFELAPTSSTSTARSGGSPATSSTGSTPLSQRRSKGSLQLPSAVVAEAARAGGAAGELYVFAKSASDLGRRRGSGLSLPDELAASPLGAAGELFVPAAPASPNRTGKSTFGTPHREQSPNQSARDKAQEAVDEFDSRSTDSKVTHLTTALMREFVAKHAGHYPELREAFEHAFPRDDQTVTRRSVMCTALRIPEAARDDPESILERLVRSRIEMPKQSEASRFQNNLSQQVPSTDSSSKLMSGSPMAMSAQAAQAAGAPTSIPSGAFNTSESLGLTGESSLCFNMTDDGSGVDINGLNVGEKTATALFRIKDLSELDVANADIIGKGAGGRVMRVVHVPSGEKLAVKEIFVGSEETVKQIQSEVSVMWGTTNRHKSHVPSPFLVKCEGIFYQGGSLMIAMELMDGSLKDALDVHGPFSEEQVKGMTFQILQGLQYMHMEKKQLHRDIKPHNILYNRDGWVKLSDFGIASDKMATSKMGAQTFCGTLVYMSPNRAEGLPYGFEGDLWSLGITLYQLVCGKLPINNSIFEVMHLKTDPPKLPLAPPLTTPPSVRRSYSKAFNDFMALCLDPEANAQKNHTVRDCLLTEWMHDMTLSRSQKIVQGVFSEIMTRTQRAAAGHKPVGLGQRDDLFATLDDALA